VVHRARGLRGARKATQGRDRAFPLRRPARAHGPQRRPRGECQRRAHRLGDLLRHRQRTLPDGTSLPRPGLRRRRHPPRHLPGRGHGPSRHACEGGEQVPEVVKERR